MLLQAFTKRLLQSINSTMFVVAGHHVADLQEVVAEFKRTVFVVVVVAGLHQEVVAEY